MQRIDKWKQTLSCTAEGEPDEENGPDEAWGYFSAGGSRDKDVLWWKKYLKKK